MKWYVRIGTTNVIRLYDGSLDGLHDAMEDAMLMSAEHGAHTVYSRTPATGLVLIARYEDGELTWTPHMEQEGG